MMTKGLSTKEASELLNTHGYNELPSEKPKNVLRIALEVIKEPLFVLLITSGVLYMVLGDYREGIILLSTIFIIIFITFYQYQKTEKALEVLKNLSSPRALVIRDGKETRIPGREVVPNDILILNEGDRIAADGVLVETMNLTIDESLLTGESVAVNKSVQHEPFDSNGLIYSGTMVIQGRGLARVMSTGIQTQFGKIGTSLQSIQQDETRLQKEMKVLIRNLFIIGAIISVGVIAAFYFTRGNFLQSLLNGLASAIAILPEEFPVVLTIFLALGAWRLSRINVLTRKPSAIETLGSATVLCTDKTGTLTQNKMDIAILYNGSESFTKDSFAHHQHQILPILTTARQASQNRTVDPMEKAIGDAYANAKGNVASVFHPVKEYSLSRSFLAMSRVLQDHTTNQYTIACKGAPETVLSLCKLTSEDTAKYATIAEQFAEKGCRVIAVASSSWPNTDFPEEQTGFEYTFRGLIGFEDPIRQEVPQAIKESKEAGLKVIMITGDFPSTARSIANQIGMDSAKEMLTGEELNTMTDESLKSRISGVNIFARVIPEQKLRIVEALKANNEIVAMTGDGVNDAPALKAAHIGIAMGSKGTDVAREASSLVLLDDNFASIVSAVRLGRKIFDNLQKAMSYIIAIHMPIIGLALLPAFFPSLPILLMPLHIVLMELIIDPSCSIAFEYEQEEKNIMHRPPRDSKEKFFGGKKIFSSALQGMLLLAMTMTVYFLSIREGHSDGEVRAIAFSSLIIGNLFLILTNLSRTRSMITVFREKNYAILIIFSSAIVMLMLIISVPFLQHIFSFEFPGYTHFIPAVAGSLSILFILESVKYFANRNGGNMKSVAKH